jgi:hypothetical protein
MRSFEHLGHRALEHVEYLAREIGARGSCTPQERQAAAYAAGQLRAAGARRPRLEPFRTVASTYRPYALAFTLALLGTALVAAVRGPWAMAAAALLNALGAGGMLAETDFAGNWMRRLLPKATSQNALGLIPPSGEVRRRAVLCAHLDSHRTPIFYASPTWHLLFGILVGAAFASMTLAVLAYGLGAFFTWDWVRWLGVALGAVQLLALALCLHADATPFSPGANDNASGVGVVLALAEQLAREPLQSTEVWLVLTGCEEVAAYGMAAFLDSHGPALGEEAVYVILDQVGAGRLIYLTADGLILKRPTHPRALTLARQAAAAVDGLETAERVGIAYTDAAVATKRGLAALTVVALPRRGSEEETHWHQMSDRVEHVDPATLADACAFAWQVLHEIDGEGKGHRTEPAFDSRRP